MPRRWVVVIIVSLVTACGGSAAPPPSPALPVTRAPKAAPSPYLLELQNVDGPPVDVLIAGVVVAHLECAGYGRLIEGVGHTPQLPWAITVRRTTGEVLFGPRPFDGGGSRLALLIRGTSVFLTGGPSGPTSEPCSRWDASPLASMPSPTPEPSYGIGHLIPAIDPNLRSGASVGAACPFNLINPHVSGILTGDQQDPWVVWLVDDRGRRLNVLWPAGFTVSEPPGAFWLLDEAQRTVAVSGERVDFDQVAPTSHTGSAADPYLAQGLAFSTCYVETTASPSAS